MQTARRHMLMQTIWLPLVVWMPVYIAIVGVALVADQSVNMLDPF